MPKLARIVVGRERPELLRSTVQVEVVLVLSAESDTVIDQGGYGR